MKIVTSSTFTYQRPTVSRKWSGGPHKTAMTKGIPLTMDLIGSYKICGFCSRSSSSSSSSQSSGQNSPISQGSSGGNPSSNNESRADPTSSSKASNKMEHPLQDLEDRHEDRTSLSMSEQALDTSRALGAIPKHSRQLQSTLLTL